MECNVAPRHITASRPLRDTAKRHAGLAFAILSLGNAACSRSNSEVRQHANATSATLAVVTNPLVNPGPAVRDKTPSEWHGTWTGHYALSKSNVPLPEAKRTPAAWRSDSGSHGSGRGSITCSVDERGVVQGSLSPVALQVRGHWDDVKSIAAAVEPAIDALSVMSFTGTLQGTRQADGTLQGTLRLTSGDGKLVRSGPFTLTRTGT